ncbi:GlsB/YeaQ/YmgE family stress response membrane protein [Actinosynnema sp. NPDC023794]
MAVSGIVSVLVVGLITGALGRLALPGEQSIPIWLTIVVGIVAAVIGTFIANALGVGDTRGIDWIEVVIQVALAAGGVAVAAGSYTRKRVS